jgi:murein DD-endopeptidase MepM/ murein hydrolase activator NlpD
MALVGGKKNIKGALAIGLAAVLLVLPMAASAGATDPIEETCIDPLSGAPLEANLENPSCLLDEPTIESVLSPTNELAPQPPTPSENNLAPTTSQPSGAPGQEISTVDSASSSPELQADNFDRSAPNPYRDYRPGWGPRSTVELMGILTRLGMSQREMAEVVAPFPVLGPASYSDDWGAPRHDPYFHPHEGTDVFAPRGTPVIASSNGVVTLMWSGSGPGGTSLRLTAADGTYYYYAHLDRFAPRLHMSQRAVAGEVLGFVGTTGNAEGGLPHLHFEIHPYGGAAVPPVPYLDGWLAEALAAARAAPGPTSVFSAIGDFAYRVEAAPLNQPLVASANARNGGSWAWIPILAVAIALGIWVGDANRPGLGRLREWRKSFELQIRRQAI